MIKLRDRSGRGCAPAAAWLLRHHDSFGEGDDSATTGQRLHRRGTRGSGEVTIEQAGTESLTIEADERFLGRLTSDVAYGALRLGTRSNAMMMNREPIKYRIAVNELTGITITGSGSMTVPKLSTTGRWWRKPPTISGSTSRGRATIAPMT